MPEITRHRTTTVTATYRDQPRRSPPVEEKRLECLDSPGEAPAKRDAIKAAADPGPTTGMTGVWYIPRPTILYGEGLCAVIPPERARGFRLERVGTGVERSAAPSPAPQDLILVEESQCGPYPSLELPAARAGAMLSKSRWVAR